MDGLDLLRLTYEWLPTAVLIDLVVLQFALRWGYRRHAGRAVRARGRSDG